MQRIGQFNWQYNMSPLYSEELMVSRATEAMQLLTICTPEAQVSYAADTRELHRRYFLGLTPSEMDYFAGNYRGSPFGALADYPVFIGGFQGRLPAYVADSMIHFGLRLKERVRALDWAWQISDGTFPKSDKLVRLVEISCELFVDFVAIHPYADGNGHMSRLLVYCLFNRYQIRVNLPVHPSLYKNEFGACITAYRNGNKLPLVKLFFALLS